jgi:hypothetical protein
MNSNSNGNPIADAVFLMKLPADVLHAEALARMEAVEASDPPPRTHHDYFRDPKFAAAVRELDRRQAEGW